MRAAMGSPKAGSSKPSARGHSTAFIVGALIGTLLTLVSNGSKGAGQAPVGRSLPANRTSKPPAALSKPFSVYDGRRAVAITQISCNATWKTFVASPSIVRLPNSSSLLVVMERDVHSFTSKAPPAAMNEFRRRKAVFRSDDGGARWAEVGAIRPMFWPQVFAARSGVYVVGVNRVHTPDNQLCISKMLDSAGARWSLPVNITTGLGAISGNTGVEVSGGRVLKTFEVNPQFAAVPARSTLTRGVTMLLPGGAGVGGEAWTHPPSIEVSVQDASQFIEYTLVQIAVPGAAHAAFFRIEAVFLRERVVRLRLQRFCLEWLPQRVELAAGAALEVAPGKSQYVSLDWVAMAIVANETADLTLPESWTLVERGVGNPAALHSDAMRALFDIGQDPRGRARNFTLGFDVPSLAALDKRKRDSSVAAAWEAGFGTLYWMEGVAVRLRDRHGGNGKVLSIMRVNNDLLCDLAALVEYDDVSTPGRLTARFLRYAFVPGLAVAHPALLYDAPSDLYWMVSNVNRDALRRWNTTNKGIRWNAFTMCETDRSTLALYYSPNAATWHFATVIDYHLRLDRHYTYPHAIVQGDDLLVVTRGTYVPSPAATVDACFNNHNSPAIVFHRVPRFREHAAAEWALYQGNFSRKPRRSTLHDEHPAPALRPRGGGS